MLIVDGGTNGASKHFQIPCGSMLAVCLATTVTVNQLTVRRVYWRSIVLHMEGLGEVNNSVDQTNLWTNIKERL